MRLDTNAFMATVHISIEGGTYTPNSWNKIGTIPEGKRPNSNIYFALYDNNVYQGNSNYVIDGRIDSTGGVYVYAFSGDENMTPYGSVSYALDPKISG